MPVPILPLLLGVQQPYAAYRCSSAALCSCHQGVYEANATRLLFSYDDKRPASVLGIFICKISQREDHLILQSLWLIPSLEICCEEVSYM